MTKSSRLPGPSVGRAIKLSWTPVSSCTKRRNPGEMLNPKLWLLRTEKAVPFAGSTIFNSLNRSPKSSWVNALVTTTRWIRS